MNQYLIQILLASLFNIVTGIMCIDMDEEEDGLLTSIRDNYQSERVIIATNIECNDKLHEFITIGDDEFELQYVASILNQCFE